jgi:hypothetical protein
MNFFGTSQVDTIFLFNLAQFNLFKFRKEKAQQKAFSLVF